MHRILIVDDEPAIVNGLVKLFSDCKQLELGIYKAYSAYEAIEIMKKQRIDIVLSDIRMPGMNGLQLLEQILFYWPSCKVIFLTGHNEFEYVYEAIHNPGVNYLLKTERDDVLIDAVTNAITAIMQENEKESIIKNAKKHKEEILPLLKKELFESILSGEALNCLLSSERFSAVKTNVNFESPLLMVACKVDFVGNELAYTEKIGYLFVVKDLVGKNLGSVTDSECIFLDHSRVVWFFQPSPGSGRFVQNNSEQDWNLILSFFKGSLEIVQDLCKHSMGIGLSFVISHCPMQWDSASDEFELVKGVLSRRVIQGKEMIIDLNTPNDLFKNEQNGILANQADFNKKLKSLEAALENANISGVETLCAEMINQIKNGLDKNYLISVERYFTLALGFCGLMNKYSLYERFSQDISVDKLKILDFPDDWEKTERFFIGLGRYICMSRKEQAENENNMVIEKIHRYIKDNLGGDISLSKLADLVFFNPSYLSRFYKQAAGRNLSDYINEVKLDTAKKMLEDLELKVNEIGIRLGFESPSYFTAFFKKMAGMTPQDYRNISIMQN